MYFPTFETQLSSLAEIYFVKAITCCFLLIELFSFPVPARQKVRARPLRSPLVNLVQAHQAANHPAPVPQAALPPPGQLLQTRQAGMRPVTSEISLEQIHFSVLVLITNDT